MADKDKTSGSEAARDADAGFAEATTRRFPQSVDDRTIFQPSPRRPGGLRPIGRPGEAAAQAGQPMAPRRAAQEAVDLNVAHENPLMQAAGPLLLLLGRLRSALVKTQVSTIVPQIILAIGTVETAAKAAGVAPAIAERAKYCLCVTADEVVTNLPNNEGSGAESGIARHFFGGRLRDDNFLASITAETNNDRNLMELQHACLALAFFGNSRVVGADAAAVQTARRDLYERLEKSGPAVATGLSPRWQGLALPAAATRLQIPFWAITGIIGIALFGLYLMFRTVLAMQAETVAQSLRQLTPPGTVIVHSDSEIPPPSPGETAQLERLRKALADLIAAGNVTLDSTSSQIVIRIPGRAIFQPESATLTNDFAPLAQQIGQALNKEPGPVKITGNTDDAPLPSGSPFVSRLQLSALQAKAVANLLKRSLTDPARITAEGNGPDVPLVSGSSPEARAKNYRIEITIERSN